jgi:predicted HTH transcriptional regulator
VVRLIELLKRHEGKTLEFKRDLSSPEGILKTLVAFANTAGGTVVIGVEDGSKNVRGVPDVLASEEKLANLVSDSIRPRLIPDTDVVPWRNLNVLAVQVYPSNTRPHYLERLGPDAGVFIRVGSTNRRAEALQIEELKRWNRMDSFDEQAVPDLKSEAIDFRAASEFFAPYRQLTSQAWSTLRITTEHQGRQVPTIGGLLLSVGTGSPGSRMPGFRRAVLRAAIERDCSIRWRSGLSCRGPRMKLLLLRANT